MTRGHARSRDQLVARCTWCGAWRWVGYTRGRTTRRPCPTCTDLAKLLKARA